MSDLDPPPNAEDSLFIAAARHDVDGVQSALGRGANVNARIENGVTPLQAAIDPAGRLDVSLHLSGRGITFDANEREETGAYSTRRSGLLEVTRALIAAGADINARDNRGKTPLHAAARPGGAPVVEALIASGADARAADKDGYTPLHLIAMLSDDVEAAAALIAAGADVNAEDRFGKTPIDHTGVWENRLRVPQLLIKAGATTSGLDKGWRRRIAKTFMQRDTDQGIG